MKLQSAILYAVLGGATLSAAAYAVGPSLARGAPAAPATKPKTAYPSTSAGVLHLSTSSSPASSSSAAPAASAAPLESRFDLPAFDKDPFPTERSELPTSDEWKSAPAVEISRRSAAARACRVYRVREYLKVHCGIPMAGLRQLAGNPKDVLLFVVPKTMDGSLFDPPLGGQVIFPLRKGEARLFQFFEIAPMDYEGVFPGPSVVVDASWPDGTSAPTVVLR